MVENFDILIFLMTNFRQICDKIVLSSVSSASRRNFQNYFFANFSRIVALSGNIFKFINIRGYILCCNHYCALIDKYFITLA